jgi:hypothetical protein
LGAVLSFPSVAIHRAIRTAHEIQTELSKLSRLRGMVKGLSALGDDDHAAIDAVMRVLGERMTADDAAELWDGDDYVLSAAIDAVECVRGDGVAPSAGWLEMAGEGQLDLAGVSYAPNSLTLLLRSAGLGLCQCRSLCGHLGTAIPCPAF